MNGETDLVGGFDGGPGDDLKREAGEHCSPSKRTLGGMAYIPMHGAGLHFKTGIGTTECDKTTSSFSAKLTRRATMRPYTPVSAQDTFRISRHQSGLGFHRDESFTRMLLWKVLAFEKGPLQVYVLFGRRYP